MKKILLTLLALFLTGALFAQVEKSDYEKYWEAREAARFGDTIKKTNAVIEKQEFDDLYYIAQKNDSLKKLQKEIRLEKRELRKEKNQIEINNYYMSDEYHYANLINRYHRGSFSFWFDYNYSPFYYNFWYYGWYDPFYYNWYSPYYSWYSSYYWYHPHYYHHWYSPYYSWNYRYWNYPRYYINNTYNYYGYSKPQYNNVQHGRRISTSTLSNNYQPNVNRRSASTTVQPQTRTVTTTQERRTV